MTKPITDKAEIALEYPDKLYVGTFESSSRFEAHLDATGIALILERPGLMTSTNRFTCTSISVCSLTYCEILPRRSLVFRSKMSCIGISSCKRSLSYMRR